MHRIGREETCRLRGVAVAVFAAVCLLGSFGAVRAAADGVTDIDVTDVASATWSGSSFASFANNPGQSSVVNIGDVNGDGVDDVAVTKTASAIIVLFTPPSGHNDGLEISDLKPWQGYEVRVQPGPVHSVAAVGDQNGDGVPDIAVGQSNQSRVTVTYGVRDPSSLPTCASGAAKCLDATLANLTPADGFVLTGPGGSNFGGSIAHIGKFRGSDANNFAVGAMYADAAKGAVYVVSESLEPEASPVDVTSVDASEVLTISASQPGAVLGALVNGLGDFNGDGFTDLYVLENAGNGNNPPRGYVIYGGEDLSNPLDLSSFASSSGFTLAPPILPFWNAVNTGDVNGDGHADLAVGGVTTVSQTGGAAVLYGSSSPLSEPISMSAPAPEQGYAILPADGETNGSFGIPLAPAGDLNGDGVPDQMFSAQAASVGGNTAAGSVNLVFGQRPTPQSPIKLGPDLNPAHGMALVGPSSNARLGGGAAFMGDVDGDGLPDYMLGSAGQARVFLVMGSSLVGQAKTGFAGAVGTDRATLGGVGVSNGRESTVYFEYGTSDSYGNTTPVKELGHSSAWRSIDTNIAGLRPETKYHFRLVVENDLGIKSFGGDRTFITSEDRCAENPQNTPGCEGFDFCRANPDSEGCKAPALSASWSRLVARPNLRRVKRGGSTKVSAWITSTGSAPISRAKVCIRVPRKVKAVGTPCRKIGRMATGATRMVKFKVRVKRSARLGVRPKLRLNASAPEVANRKAQTRIRVRR